MVMAYFRNVSWRGLSKIKIVVNIFSSFSTLTWYIYIEMCFLQPSLQAFINVYFCRIMGTKDICGRVTINNFDGPLSDTPLILLNWRSTCQSTLGWESTNFQAMHMRQLTLVDYWLNVDQVPSKISTKCQLQVDAFQSLVWINTRLWMLFSHMIW